MNEETEKVVPLQELTKERETRQRAEAAAKEVGDKLSLALAESSAKEKMLEEAAKRLSMLDELHSKYTALEHSHGELSSRYEKEILLAEQGVTNPSDRKFAVFHFAESGQADFQAWFEAQRESGARWLPQQTSQASRALPTGVPRSTQAQAPDELGTLASMNKEEKTEYWRKKFPQFATKRN
jgi:hypothetical protein